MDDVVGGDSSSPKRMPKQSGCQKTKTGKLPSVLDNDKCYHKPDYRTDADHARGLTRDTRCRFCGGLIAANYLSEHLFFCRAEHGGKRFKPTGGKT